LAAIADRFAAVNQAIEAGGAAPSRLLSVITVGHRGATRGR